MKVYEVIFQDEYDNLYQLGFYRELDDAIPDLNGYLEYVPGFALEKGDIREYPCTFGPAFDTFLWDLYEARMGKDPEDGLVEEWP